jgi:iron complex outermembrane recepter protein
VRNDIFQRKADLYSFGYNAEYDGDDGWKAFIDIGYSRTDRNELSIESYSGTGFNGDGSDQFQGDGTSPSDSIGFTSGPSGTFFDPTLDYSNPALIRLTDPLGWGGGTVPQAGYYNNRIIEDELKQYRVGVEKEVEGFFSAIKFGLNYTDRQKSLTADEAFVRLPGGALQTTIPSQYLLRSTNLAYLGLGPIVSYDARELLADGILVLEPRITTGPTAANDVLAKNYLVTEDLMTAYLQADIEQEMGSSTLTGNVGVQVINTEQNSRGLIFAPTGPQPVKFGDNYWDILPSLNLSMRFDSDFVIRFAASRQIQRPRLNDLRAAINYGISSAIPGGLIRGDGGNPFLKPYRANSFDLNFEKYFGSSGVISAQLFYKDIKSFIFTGLFPFDYSGFPPPAGAAGFPSLPTVGLLEAPINTGGGKLYGAELAVTLPFSTFTDALDGFGVTGGVGYTKSDVEDANGNRSTIPGYSKWVANGTAYFEKWGFNARGSVRYRSKFLGDFSGFGGNLQRKTALAEMIVDGQIGYDFQEGSALSGLSLYLQGQNLTDERFAAVADSARPLTVLDYQIYGRRFLAGFTFKF